MNSKANCRVLGLTEDGLQVVITRYITRDNAARLVRLIQPYSAFANLMIECDDDRGEASR